MWRGNHSRDLDVALATGCRTSRAPTSADAVDRRLGLSLTIYPNLTDTSQRRAGLSSKPTTRRRNVKNSWGVYLIKKPVAHKCSPHTFASFSAAICYARCFISCRPSTQTWIATFSGRAVGQRVRPVESNVKLPSVKLSHWIWLAFCPLYFTKTSM